MTLLLLACTGADPASGDTVEPFLMVEDDTLQVEVGVALSLPYTASEGEVTWSFGDGESAEGVIVESHAWAEAGNYVVVVLLTDDEGRRASRTLFVEVYNPHLAVAPSRSSTLVVDGAGAAWAVTADAGVLSRVNARGAAIVEVCERPRNVAPVGGGITFAVACDDDQVAVVDPDTSEVFLRVALATGSHPWGIALDEDTIWVTLAGTGQVLSITFDAEVTVAADCPDPRGIALAAGQVYVSRFRSTPEAGSVCRPGQDPLVLPMHPGPDSDTLAGGVPNLIESLAVSPDGQTLYVPMLQSNVARGLVRSGQPLTYESTVRAALGVVSVDAAEEDWTVRKQLDNQDRVIVVEPSPTGNYLAIAHPGTGTVQFLDAFTLDAVGSLQNAGQGIVGLRWVDDTLFVHADLDRVVRAYAIGAPGTLPELLWETSLVEAEPLDAAVLQGKKLFAQSGDTRISKDGYIACASCHPDGDHDGMTWDFTSRGEGMRNTASLLGRGGTAMGYLHWSANFDEVQDFENDIRNAFGGTGLLNDADWAATSDTLGVSKAGLSVELDALAAYVTSLADTPTSPFHVAATPEREALFLASGCAECHPPPLYTDSNLAVLRLYDVGTLSAASGGRLGGVLDGLDTPTLRGAFSTGPWLHDGSASTLDEAIAAHTTLVLDAGTVSELAAFVSGL